MVTLVFVSVVVLKTLKDDVTAPCPKRLKSGKISGLQAQLLEKKVLIFKCRDFPDCVLSFFKRNSIF
jgi:hypothetical protein